MTYGSLLPLLFLMAGVLAPWRLTGFDQASITTDRFGAVAAGCSGLCLPPAFVG